ncbi:uncharacterized protein LOC118195812 isoform X2 [Stegodyphus dumicola]|uniref:uncharacterized protein LOC118195812 isoform X2 n=1 Tax=Stegodyphus dumicola TaxID=202533 RepID=UPI0015ABC77C|nr:uncharacterized protein LOC118195812 isoform X2 [Stegodyphus dumicola]
MSTIFYIQYYDSVGTEVSNPLDYYDIPAHPVPVLHLPSASTTGNATDKEPEYMKMKGSQKERAKLSLLESQAKLIEIMEAYKKGASLIEVEKLHNEWKTFYQVSDADAKSTLDGLRNLYAKAQKAKLSKKHSSSFSELRQFLNSKLRRKESIGSKGSLSRKQSKDMNSMEKLCADSDAIRPMSTLSVLSNTSSSSGSSFDRLSTASAGSDSGHHSDFSDERTNKLREKFESRYHQQHRKINGSSHNISGFQKNMQSLTLNSRPPAPPPRPTKTVSRYGSLEDCKVSESPQYSVAKKSSITTFEDALNFFDFIQTDSRSSSLCNEFRSTTMKPKLLTESLSFEDPNANYDCPPPPRPSVKPVAKDFTKTLKSNFILNDPKTDYDLVPPPLPVSSPPRKQDTAVCDRDQSYDIPNPSVMLHPFQRSNSISSNYDFPKTTLMDNTDIQPACTCQVSVNKNSFCSVKSCCIGNKLSSLKQVNSLPSVPNTDIVTSVEKEKQLRNLNESRVQIKNLNENRSVHNQYYNVCLRPPRDTTNEQRDSIPEEMAPPPPVIEKESPEEHYKMVGTPVPVPSAH